MPKKKSTVKKKKYVATSINQGRKLETFIQPMLAKETKTSFDDKDWLFEIKWDGYRAITEKNKNKIALYSRNGITFEHTYPIIVNQLKLIEEDVILDGEIVVLDDEGHPSFQFLQHYSENSHRPIQYHIFDLLNLNVHDITELTLVEKKRITSANYPGKCCFKNTPITY